jgi:ketosteroid isomerase-like protein
MHHPRSFVAILAAAVLGCSQSAPAPDTAAEVEAINQVREREITAFSAGDVEALAGVLTAESHVMPPNEPALVGADAAKSWAQALANQFTLNGRYTSANVTVAGDYAFERYTAELTITPKTGGAAMTEIIKGIHVYQKQTDGSWRIIQDAWNSDAPPPAPASQTNH